MQADSTRIAHAERYLDARLSAGAATQGQTYQLRRRLQDAGVQVTVVPNIPQAADAQLLYQLARMVIEEQQRTDRQTDITTGQRVIAVVSDDVDLVYTAVELAGRAGWRTLVVAENPARFAQVADAVLDWTAVLDITRPVPVMVMTS